MNKTAATRQATGLEHEREFVTAFILREKRERTLFLLGNRRRRREFTSRLAHFSAFDAKFAKTVPASIAHGASEWAALLQSRGAQPTAWLISEDSALDATELPLSYALETVWGSDMGTIVSCVPGRLAYFKGEEMNSELLLERSF